MDEPLYDEFGNYVGPPLDQEEEEEEEEALEARRRPSRTAATSAHACALLAAAPRRTRGSPVQPRATLRGQTLSSSSLPSRAATPRLAQDERWMEEAEARAKMATDAMQEDEGAAPSSALVLAEDKKYYPSAEEVYGAGTEALVMDEDAQQLEEPIIASVKKKRFEVLEREALPSHASPEFLVALSATPALVRNVCVAGHLHHGKTSLLDMLISQTHTVRHAVRSSERGMRYTDTRKDEQEREMSVKAVPMSLVHTSSTGKSFLLNLMDTPGHVAFSDELCCGLRLSDGVLLVVDCVEGVCMNTEKALQAAVAEGLPVCVFLNKMDRLILELKLPPADAYYKLRHTLEELNALLAAAAPDAPPFDPAAGNVAFGATSYGWSFTLHSFARLYADVQRVQLDPKAMAQRLWGDWYHHPESRAFRRAPPAGGAASSRTFVSFILEPLYKLHTACVGETPQAVASVLDEFGVALKPSVFKQDVKPLLTAACTAILGDAAGLVDMLTQQLPSAAAGCANKAQRCYTGPQTDAACAAIAACDPSAPLVAHVAKLVPSADGTRFDALCRVMCGTLRDGAMLRVLGEAYTPDDEEDSQAVTVSGLWVLQARYRIPVSVAGPGSWVLIGGIDHPISKTATLVPVAQSSEETYIMAPLRFNTASVVKIATEPLHPADLPKLVAGLRKISKSYPLAITRVEESGEHSILGTGELYLDCVMRDLREMYADVEIKVADPTVRFCETVVETSSLKCFAETPNKANKLTVVAEPLDAGLGAEIEAGRIRLDMPRAQLADTLQSKYGWDILAARSLWAFGPDSRGPNVLLDDTLPGEADKRLLAAVRDSVTAGFQWGAREGPLCDEPMRGVKFKLLQALIAPEPLQRGGGQVIPTARRVIYSSFLLASPRLMEPMFRVDMHAPADAMSAIYSVLSRRRGHVVSDRPVPGTPVYAVRAVLPAIESFGFETDVRVQTLGAAFGMSCLDGWAVVPGDPLDKSIVLRPLEPSAPSALAREFTLKTRRRKGMSEETSVGRYFDDPALLELAREDPALGHLL